MLSYSRDQPVLSRRKHMKINVRETIIRLLLLFLGLIIAHLGVTLFLLADLGADPFNVLIQGLRLLVIKTGLSPTHGTAHMCVCFLIVIILLFADRKYVKLGTLVCMFCGGPIIDFFTLILQGLGISQAGLVIKIIVLVLGCGILASGMSLVIRSEAGTGPNDLVAVVISEKSGWRFSIVRIVTDVLFVLIGFLLGGKFGIGTVICAFLVGPVAERCMPVSAALVAACLKKAKNNHLHSEHPS